MSDKCQIWNKNSSLFINLECYRKKRIILVNNTVYINFCQIFYTYKLKKIE